MRMNPQLSLNKSRSSEESPREIRKCLRHQLKPTFGFCGLCHAYEIAEGDFEKARRIFIKGESNAGSPAIEKSVESSNLVIEYAEIG